MAQKPVPYVQRGDRKYIVDHHHTLVALELSGYDPEITLEQVRSFDKNEQSIEAFWVRHHCCSSPCQTVSPCRGNGTRAPPAAAMQRLPEGLLMPIATGSISIRAAPAVAAEAARSD